MAIGVISSIVISHVVAGACTFSTPLGQADGARHVRGPHVEPAGGSFEKKRRVPAALLLW